MSDLPALGTARLLTFALRGVVLLIALSLLWLGFSAPYNRFLVWAAAPMLPDAVSVSSLGAHILFQSPTIAAPVSIDGLTLHYGLILMAVVVLAAVGVGPVPRAVWLAAMAAAAFVAHVTGVALLGWGVLWASSPASSESAGRTLFSLFAVSWGMLPAMAALAWCRFYWLPAVRKADGR